jgi:hypothetical protein
VAKAKTSSINIPDFKDFKENLKPESKNRPVKETKQQRGHTSK